MSQKSTYTILMIMLFGMFTQCETDDYCEEDVLTPRLVVRFYDHNTSSVRAAKHLYVWAEGKDTLYKNLTTDSIALPLNVASGITKYILMVNNKSDSIWTDTLRINYSKQDIFVSRSCGYKTNFTIESVNNTNVWLFQANTINNPQTVENEKSAHIKITH